jgi:hypothetical protein
VQHCPSAHQKLLAGPISHSNNCSLLVLISSLQHNSAMFEPVIPSISILDKLDQPIKSVDEKNGPVY